jgi:hypothetical protein
MPRNPPDGSGERFIAPVSGPWTARRRSHHARSRHASARVAVPAGAPRRALTGAHETRNRYVDVYRNAPPMSPCLNLEPSESLTRASRGAPIIYPGGQHWSSILLSTTEDTFPGFTELPPCLPWSNGPCLKINGPCFADEVIPATRLEGGPPLIGEPR